MTIELNAAGEPVLLKEQTGDNDEILICRMNRPERMNSSGGGLPEAMNDAWFEFRNDNSLKVMILTGVGDRAFSAGADLRAAAGRAQRLGSASGTALLEEGENRNSMGAEITRNGLHLWKPVIAAINGWCLAGGCETAMGCDFRIMEEHAQIGLPEVKRGRGAKATTHKLSWLTYLANGMEMVWTGDPVIADRALELGLVNEVVPKGQSVERAVEIAKMIANKPQQYLTYHKERFLESIGTPLSYALAKQERYAPRLSQWAYMAPAEYQSGLETSLKTPLPGWPPR